MIEETLLIERIAALESSWSRVGTSKPTDEELDGRTLLSTLDLRRWVEAYGKPYASGEEQTRISASFLLTAMRWALSKSRRALGLDGTEPLVADRIDRILTSAERSDSFPPLSDDRTVCDCLVFFGRLIPLGLYHADVGAIPRSLIARLRLRDSWRLARYVASEMRGFGPTLGIHLPKQPDRPLSEEDYREAHRLAAQLFARNPRLRGFYNAAWYYDPAIAVVSPRLAFLPEFAHSHGAIALCLGSDEDTIVDATWKSQTRRELYAAGRYVPRRYARVWSRRAFLGWADRQGG
jgi:hypothetical protein